MATTPRNTLVLLPADTARRWRHYLYFLIVCAVVLLISLIYICVAKEPSYLLLVPLVASIYLLGSSLRGWCYMRTAVVSIDNGVFVSVSWRGCVSKVTLAEVRKILESGENLKFRDRWLKWWSGYLGGATADARASFLVKFFQWVNSEYPAIEIGAE